MNIRVLTADDALVYRALRLRALRLNPEAYLTTYDEYVSRSLDDIARQLHPSDHHFTLGAFQEDSGTLMGTVTLVRDPRPKISHIARVVAVFVAPEYRREGVGRDLLTALISRARQMPGLTQLHVNVVAENTAACKLYASVGFRVCGVIPRAMREGDRYWDECVMVLPLHEEQGAGAHGETD